MKIVIPGGSGQLGTILAREFIAQNHQVIVLSRMSLTLGNLVLMLPGRGSKLRKNSICPVRDAY
ncbi:MAG: hypothetical protein NTU79_16670 [Planctomycetota bacterium]|nr:hypothetical protein [Planctomycetota bacterium]